MKEMGRGGGEGGEEGRGGGEGGVYATQSAGTMPGGTKG